MGSFRARVTRPVAVAILLTLAALLVACGPADASQDGSPSQPLERQVVRQAEGVTPEPANIRRVRVTQVRSGSLSAPRSTSVTVEPGREARVAAGTSGQVETVVVREGGRVAAGDPVVRLSDRNLRLQVENARLTLLTARVNLEAARRASAEGQAQASAALTAARSNLDLLSQQYEGAQELYGLGAIASTELAGLETQVAQARSSLLQAEDALARSQRAGDEELELRRLQVAQAENSLAQAQSALSEAVIDAPFAGTIASLMVEEGEFIGAGSPAFRLVSFDRQRVRFAVPPADAQALLEQGQIRIPYGGLSYAAQITNSSGIPGDGRLVELTATIYPSKVTIPTGTVAQLSYRITLGEGAIVPVAALGTRAGEQYVMLVEEGEATETPVEVLAETAGEAVVEGVEPGSKVVHPLPPDLISGAPVEVIGEVPAR